jgi:exoribonuclease II
VPQYCWATSPLRRYVDLVNQRQVIAVVTGDKPRYAANDADLFSILSGFDARYGAYAEFQQRMERYWCLRWIAQQPTRRLEAVVVREDLVRLADAPLYFRMPELPALGPGRRMLVDILETDELDLSVSARFVEALAQPVAEELAEELAVELEEGLEGLADGVQAERIEASAGDAPAADGPDGDASAGGPTPGDVSADADAADAADAADGSAGSPGAPREG